MGMRARREVYLAALYGLLAACASAASAPLETNDPTVGGVGKLPGAGPEVPLQGEQELVTTETESTTTTIPASTTTLIPAVTIGQMVAGNKVLMIGDSITASAAKRYGNEFCEALVPLGWRVEVDAEPSRFIDFGATVLDARLGAKWDAAYVFLGTNYGGKQEIYQKYLEKIVERLAPIPVMVLTVTEFAANRHEVNDAILAVAATHPNVYVIDWGAIAAADAPIILRGDGHHLTNEGRVKLASVVAGVLGTAPKQPGDCLPTQFTADRGLSVNGSDTPPETPVGGGSGGSGGGGSTQTTVKGTTPTTKPPVTATTVPPVVTTQPPQTTPPPTNPTTTEKGRPPRTTVPITIPPTTIPQPPGG
jgi:hypothetical protein